MATQKRKRVGNINIHADKVNVESQGASPSKYVPPIERKSGWDNWDLDQFLRTLTEAEQIRSNKPLMRALKDKAREKLQATQQLNKSIGA